MKIKTKKKFKLDELIKYVWENGIAKKDFLSNEQLPSGKHVRVHVNPRRIDEFVRGAGISIDSGNMVVTPEYTFTVEVEEDLKMSTKLPFMVHMYIDSDGKVRSENCFNKSIIECQIPIENEEISLTMYYASSGGDLTFIWNGRDGIPEEGTLEVDTE